MINTILIFISLLFFACSVRSQVDTNDIIFPSNHFGTNQTNVLVVGTFHFDYPGLDSKQIEESDRILVLVGHAHAVVLRQLFECSPAYKFIEFDSL